MDVLRSVLFDCEPELRVFDDALKVPNHIVDD